MRASLGTFLGVSGLVLGIAWSALLFFAPMFRLVTSDRLMTTASIFVVMVLLVMSIPGLLGIFYGIRLATKPTSVSVAGAVGSQFLMATLIIATFLERGVSSTVWGDFAFFAVLLLASLIVLPFYVWTCKFVMITERIETSLIFLRRLLAILLAFEVWLASGSLLKAVTPRIEGSKYALQQPLGILGSVTSLFLAWACYKLCLKVVAKGLFHIGGHK